MRGVGEPIFEIDFPPGSDMMGEICGGPKAAERMEYELFSRFAVSFSFPFSIHFTFISSVYDKKGGFSNS